MRYLPNGIWMQKADSYTIREIGVPSVVLMEHAAQKTIEVMERENIDFSDILIVCGSGNNGGDGFAIARLLQEKGVRVTVFFAGKESSMSEECRLQAQIVRNLGIPIVTVMPEKEYTVLVDALFGVGLNREITGAYCDVIEKMNRLKGRKIAVDIPSGIHFRERNIREKRQLLISGSIRLFFQKHRRLLIHWNGQIFPGCCQSGSRILIKAAMEKY